MPLGKKKNKIYKMKRKTEGQHIHDEVIRTAYHEGDLTPHDI